MESWSTLHPRQILHAPRAISAYGSFCQASLEPRPSDQELRALPTGQLRPRNILLSMFYVSTLLLYPENTNNSKLCILMALNNS